MPTPFDRVPSPKRLIHPLLLCALLVLLVSAYRDPDRVACAVRAISPVSHYPVWCQARSWPVPTD